jgi:hypothetical protein
MNILITSLTGCLLEDVAKNALHRLDDAESALRLHLLTNNTVYLHFRLPSGRSPLQSKSVSKRNVLPVTPCKSSPADVEIPVTPCKLSLVAGGMPVTLCNLSPAVVGTPVTPCKLFPATVGTTFTTCGCPASLHTNRIHHL